MTPFEQAEIRAHRFGLMAAVQSSLKELIYLVEDCDNLMKEYESRKEIGVLDERTEELATVAMNDLAYTNESLKEIAMRVEKHFGINA